LARKEKKSVYCSGPLFSPEDTATMAAIARTLKKAGYAPFLPHRDGVEAFVLNAIDNPLANLPVFAPINRFISRAAFALDILKVLQCDYFVFNMNGRVPDEGGVVETGVAFTAGKPIVIYKNDPRTAFGGTDNPMLAGISHLFGQVDDIGKIPARLEEVAERLAALGDNPYKGENMPGFVLEVTAFGRKVWHVLRLVRLVRPRNMMASM